MDPSWIRSVCLSFSSNKFTFDLFDIYIIIFGMRYIDQLIVGRWCDTWVVVNCHCIFERHLSIRPSMRAWLLFNIVYIDIIALSSTQLNEWSLIMLQLINQLYPNQFFHSRVRCIEITCILTSLTWFSVCYLAIVHLLRHNHNLARLRRINKCKYE